MREAMIGALVLTGVALSGCVKDGVDTRTTATSARKADAFATLRDANGATKGTATLRQDADGLHLALSATGMAPGPKGLHFHMVGQCEAPAFTTAGGHWNPSGMKHGKDSGVGPHMGDLPNIEIAADGTGRIEATVSGASLTGGATPLLDTDGAAIIIHAGPDDYRTDPSGNSGSRLACGVVTPA